jgi:hypothetical protein
MTRSFLRQVVRTATCPSLPEGAFSVALFLLLLDALQEAKPPAHYTRKTRQRQQQNE